MQVAIDVGGTFTDSIAFDPSRGWSIDKVPTTPQDLSEGFLNALSRVAPDGGATSILHGTTVVINAILTRHYPRTALVTTAGFRDVLEIMRADRKDLFDIYQRKPIPLVPRSWRLEVSERIAAGGDVVEALDPSDVDDVIAKLAEIQPDAVAVCLLYSFVNPAHERQLGEALRSRLAGTHVALSHEVLPVYREFERTSTTVVNALAQPLMGTYLDRALDSLDRAGFSGRLRIMQSTGGLAEPDEARERPVFTLFSGPAGAVVTAAQVGKLAGIENVVGLDMGGTSCDVSAVTRGEPDRVTYFEVAGYPVTVASIDIVTVGAGGGSIAWLDPGGALRVGPDSAGAVPGPACYGQGGTLPTVTDAAVVLGRYRPHAAFGGEFEIDPELARSSIQEIAEDLDLSIEDAASGIVRLVNANMANALREVSVERGRDPRDYALVAGGGAGAAHAVEVAEQLGIPEVLIPPFPGAASAQGMLLADVRREQMRTVHDRLGELTAHRLAQVVEELAEETAKGLARTIQRGGEPVSPQIELFPAIDLRYSGQTYEITIPVDHAAFDAHRVEQAFHTAHASRYGHSFPRHPVEVVNVRAAAVQRLKTDISAAPDWPDRQPGAEPVYWGPDLGWLETRIVSRRYVQAQDQFAGPAVIEQPDATIIVPPQVVCTPIEGGCLRLKRASTRLTNEHERSGG